MKEDNRLCVDREFDQRELEYYSLLRGFIEDSEVSYWIGNPAVEILNGNIKLKPIIRPEQNHETTSQYFEALRQLNQDEDFSEEVTQNGSSYALLLNGIPNSKGPSELLYESPLSQYGGDILQVRVIRTTQLRYYAVLLLFPCKKVGRQCFQDLLGKEYNEVELQRFILREISGLTLHYNQLQRGENRELLLKKCCQNQHQKYSPEHIFLTSGHLQTLALKNQEKNSCSICLEELGSQIISILCGHYFHRHCLERWQFNTCPLCRYYQQPPVVTFCEQCNQSQGLWVCLLCGRRLCCGTVNDIMSEDSHIYQHCKQTGHSLSMQIQTKFLFDARVPAFLHQMFYKQLIQKGSEEDDSPLQDKHNSKKNKMSQKIVHYQKEVAEEMHKQRNYFEDHIYKLIKSHRTEISARNQKLGLRIKELQRLRQEEKSFLQQNEELSQEIVQAEKEEIVIGNLLKMKSERGEKVKVQNQKIAQLQRRRISELQALIQEKKQDLLSFKDNIALQQQLKHKLKGEKVGEEICFLHEKKHKKKK